VPLCRLRLLGWQQTRVGTITGDAYTVASGGFGGVERSIRGFEDVVVIEDAGLAGADADGHRHGQASMACGGDRLAQVLGEDRGLAGIGAGKQHRELLASEPPSKVKRAQALAHRVGDVAARLLDAFGQQLLSDIGWRDPAGGIVSL
jgi:hypothetical protein